MTGHAMIEILITDIRQHVATTHGFGIIPAVITSEDLMQRHAGMHLDPGQNHHHIRIPAYVAALTDVEKFMVAASTPSIRFF